MTTDRAVETDTTPAMARDATGKLQDASTATEHAEEECHATGANAEFDF